MMKALSAFRMGSLTPLSISVSHDARCVVPPRIAVH